MANNYCYFLRVRKTNIAVEKSPIFGISRLRMGIDGQGVTTLVTFMGCPLHCKYCLNNFCHKSIYKQDKVTLRDGIKLLSPRELYDIVKIDNLYFQSTNGGICFGGGEPALQVKFIKQFKEICIEKWKITIETSLCVPKENILLLLPIVNQWIVDIKDLNPDIYKRYTGKSINKSLSNLKLLIDHNANIMVRVPNISGYNNHYDVEQTIDRLKEMGIQNIDTFNYIIK